MSLRKGPPAWKPAGLLRLAHDKMNSLSIYRVPHRHDGGTDHLIVNASSKGAARRALAEALSAPLCALGRPERKQVQMLSHGLLVWVRTRHPKVGFDLLAWCLKKGYLRADIRSVYQKYRKDHPHWAKKHCLRYARERVLADNLLWFLDYRILIEPEEIEFDFHDSGGKLKVKAELNRRLKRGDTWAWCQVEVEVTRRDGATGSAYLGACSYWGEEDFMGGGYFLDMIEDALNEID